MKGRGGKAIFLLRDNDIVLLTSSIHASGSHMADYETGIPLLPSVCLLISEILMVVCASSSQQPCGLECTRNDSSLDSGVLHISYS